MSVDAEEETELDDDEVEAMAAAASARYGGTPPCLSISSIVLWMSPLNLSRAALARSGVKPRATI